MQFFIFFLSLTFSSISTIKIYHFYNKKIVYENFTILNNHTLQTFKYKKNPLCFAMGVSKIFLTY